jgi:hypothetical protein
MQNKKGYRKSNNVNNCFGAACTQDVSLVQRGIEKVDKAGIDRVITETYTRIKK